MPESRPSFILELDVSYGPIAEPQSRRSGSRAAEPNPIDSVDQGPFVRGDV